MSNNIMEKYNKQLDSFICNDLANDYCFIARVNKFFKQVFKINIDNLTLAERQDYFRSTLSNSTKGYLLRYVAHLYLANTLKANAYKYVDEAMLDRFNEIESIFEYNED